MTGKERRKKRKRRNQKESHEIKPSETVSNNMDYTPKFVPCLVVNRKISSGSRWKQVPRLTDRHYVDRICVGGLHWVPHLRDWGPRREGAKIVGVRGHSGHRGKLAHHIS